MRPLFRLMGEFGFVFKRLWHHPGLTLLALLGVIFAVGLVTNAYVFSQAVEEIILSRKLDEYSRITGRSAFSTAVLFTPSTRQPMSLRAAEDVAPDVAGTIASEVGLPVRHLGVRVTSGAMSLKPGASADLYDQERPSLGVVDLVYIAGVEGHMDIVAGEGLGADSADGALDVWMHRGLAEEMGAQIGDRFSVGTNVGDIAVPLQLRGFWQARDTTDPFWFTNPDQTLKTSLLVRGQDYVTYAQPLVPSKTRLVRWHVILDEDKALPDEARSYMLGFERANAIINKFVPGADLNAPALYPLEEFVARETNLTILVLSFNLPAFGFLLYFLILTSVIVARWQRRDTATLVSRGMNIWDVLSLTLVEELLLFVVGLPLGLGLGMLLARLMGYTSSFLAFVDRPPVPVSLRGVNLPVVLAALAVALFFRLWPAAQAARQSVVQVERERARPTQGPFWYRTYLDILLLFPTVYAYDQLVDRGTLALLVQDRPEDLYQDPLLIVVPALFILTAALMTLRVFPLLMHLLDRLAGAVPWITPHMVMRRLSRQIHDYINPLLLIVVSLALGVYTVSMAASFDQWLVDRMYYRVGADLTFKPLPPVQVGPDSGQAVQPVDGAWIPLPYQFRELPGVSQASRVADYRVTFDFVTGNRTRGRFLAIDRFEFPSVAWYRGDFADEPLGGLMNRLALFPDGVLVSEQLLTQNHLQIGDKVRLRVAINADFVVNTLFTVAGAYKYFPTIYEDDEVTFIGNLEYLSNQMGATLPHNIWMRIQDGADGQTVIRSIPQAGIYSTREENARALIAQERAKEERVGVFGTLTIGFIAAVVMAAIGLLIYSYASLQERLYRFAVLRAMGLRRRQIVSQVILEYALLTVCGAVAGALIGVAASEIFVPLFRVTGEQGIPLPPLIPIIAEGDVRQLVIAFTAAMVLMELVVIARGLSWRYASVLRGQEE